MDIIDKEIGNLINMSMAAGSWKTYGTAVCSFNNFRKLYRLDLIWLAPLDSLAQFIAYLSHKGMSASTVATYISGLSHCHKLNDLQDNTQSFIIKKLLEGMRRKYPQRTDIMAPIFIQLLKHLILALRRVCGSNYESLVFSTAFSIAYFGMLRVSEIAVNSRSDESGHALNLDDVSFSENCNTLHIRLLSSKTDQKHRSVTLFVSKQPDSDLCPVRLLQSFLKLRFSGLNGSNKLFVHVDGACLSKYQFSSVLQMCLQFCDIPLHIRSHSFRIGRATDLARFGVEDDHIKQCGRWSSDSYLRYIRL